MFKGHGGNIKIFNVPFHNNNGNVYGDGVIDFSASINPLGYPEGVQRAILEKFDIIMHYPEIDCAGLREYIAGRTGHAHDRIIIGNGSTELFYLIPRALKPLKGMVLQPAFSEFAEALKCSGAEVIHHVLNPENGFCFSYHKGIFQDRGIEMVFLCNPNNPTGRLIDRDIILSMAKHHPDITFVVDEAFIDFVDKPQMYSVIQEAHEMYNLIVVRSLTKFYGFPGLRIGYLIAHVNTVKKIMEFKEPWTVNTFAQYAAMFAMEDRDFICRSREFMSYERQYLFHELSNIPGLSPYKPTANYILVRINRDGLTSTLLCKRLLEFGIAIRDCSNFVGLDERYIRMAVRTREENTRLINALKDLCTRAEP